jgi:hypothetical protein
MTDYLTFFSVPLPKNFHPKVDLIFLVETSSAMGPKGVNAAKAFIHNIIVRLPVREKEIRVGLFSFDVASVAVSWLNSHKKGSLYLTAVKKIKYTGGKTKDKPGMLGVGLNYVLTNAFTKGKGGRTGKVAKIVVVLGSGRSQKPNDAETFAKKLRKAKANVFMVSLNKKHDKKLMNKVGTPGQTLVIGKSDSLKFVHWMYHVVMKVTKTGMTSF